MWFARVIYLLLNDFPLQIHQEVFDITELSTTVTATLIYHWGKTEDAKKSKAVQSMIRLMMTGPTWKLRACFVKDVRGKKTCNILGRNLTREHTQGDIWELQPQQWKWAPTLQWWKQERPQKALRGSAHFFLLLRFCWKGRCEIRPSYKLKVLSNHLAFHIVWDSKIWKPVSQSCTAKCWFRDADMNWRPSILFPIEPDNCSVI